MSDNGVSVKTTPATLFKVAKLGIFDATTGAKIKVYDLAALTPDGQQFANDITYDEAGNIYVTNSKQPVIYKIDTKGVARVFATSPRWSTKDFNLNGIIYHPDGYLIAAHVGTGELYKVSTTDSTKIDMIKAPIVPGADGLIYNPKTKELISISNSTQQVFRLKSTDGWASAEQTGLAKTPDTFATTGCIAKGKYYVLNAKLNEIFNPESPKSNDFLLQEVVFTENK